MSTSYDPHGFTSGLSSTVVAFLMVGLVVPGVRLVLDLQRSVGSWLDIAAGARQAVPPSRRAAPTRVRPLLGRERQDCHAGDLSACDDLYVETPVSSLYEWLGKTCGGRQEEETLGSCD